MSQEKKAAGRRTFLAGLATGVGAVAALMGIPRPVSAKKERGVDGQQPGPLLYRRTEDVERYYRTLYR